MRYAISYVSTVNPNLTENEIQQVLNFSKDWNNEHDVTGILLYSEGNFFQVIEGEEKKLLDLFSRIRNDGRHQNLIVIFERQVAQTKFKNYQADFISLDSRFETQNFDTYLSQVEKLNPGIQSSVRYILNKFTEGIKSI